MRYGCSFVSSTKARRLFAALATHPRIPGRHVRPELRPIELLAGIEQQHVDALAGEVPRRHPTGRAGTDDDDGVDSGGGLDRHWLSTLDERRTQNADCPP